LSLPDGISQGATRKSEYYSQGVSLVCHHIPPQVDEETFVKTIDSINTIFDDAEALNCGAYSEGCLFCLTGYTLHFCYKTNYERVGICVNDD